jgi:hypothetical protein
LPLPGEQTEVVPEQQDRVEALAGADGAVERSQPRIGEPSLPRNLDGERRDVDPDHLVPSALEVQADAQPRSSTRPRTNLIARRSCAHHDRNGAR